LVEGALGGTLQQQRRSLPAHLIGGRKDRRQARTDVVREIEAVGHLDVTPYRQMPVDGLGHGGDRHLIVAAHEDVRQALAIDVAADRQLRVGDASAAARSVARLASDSEALRLAYRDDAEIRIAGLGSSSAAANPCTKLSRLFKSATSLWARSSLHLLE
jgi:hypothetical protein